MPKFAWMTDLHMNFLSQKKIAEFVDSVDPEIDGIIVTGDISTGPQVSEHLRHLEEKLRKPIWFILGNHDFYRSSFAKIEKQMDLLKEHSPNLIYLTSSGVIPLTQNIGLIGHDGWYDAAWKEPLTSLVFIWDWFCIADFRALFSNKERLGLSRERAEQAAMVVRERLRQALSTYSTVILATHFPPWPEADPCSFSISEKFWHPYNSSRVMGEMLSLEMSAHPDKKLIVLAGHTHGDSHISVGKNIDVRVGGAARGSCSVKEYLSF